MTDHKNRPQRIWVGKDDVAAITFWFETNDESHIYGNLGPYVPASLLDAANERVARLEEALRWYGEQVSNCNRHGKEGDTARDTLAKDYGQRAEAALQTEGKEGE